MEEGFNTILLQSQARGEAEVGRDDRLVEVVDVQHSEPGGVSLGTSGTEGDGVVGGSGPDGTEGGSDEVGVSCSKVVDGGGGFIHPHHLCQTEPSLGIVGEGDEVADSQWFVGEGVVMGRRGVLRCPVRPCVDQRSLKDAVGTVFRHLVRGAGEDHGDGA